MTYKKRKKNTRQRASKTHGWGSMKKHRGAGNRGGRGMAGTGKRADSFKPSIWKEKYFGRKGFVKKNIRRKLVPLNLSHLEENLGRLLKENKISEKDGVFVIDADKIGVKVLGSGRITKKFRVTASRLSEKAKKKIEEAGGEVVIKEEFKKEEVKDTGKKDKKADKEKEKVVEQKQN